MTKPRPSSQNIQIQGETLEKIDDLRDAAHRRGLRKSYPGVVADAVNVFYDISTGATTSVLQQVADQREVTLGISVMAILVTVIPVRPKRERLRVRLSTRRGRHRHHPTERVHRPDASNGRGP